MSNVAKRFLQTVAVVMTFMMAFCATSLLADGTHVDSATCDIGLSVLSIVEWEGLAFPSITLTDIDAQADQPTGSSTYTLWTNANIALSADNTAAGPAVLTHSEGVAGEEDFLVTEYDIYTDGFGLTETGAKTGARTTSGTCTLNNTRVWSLYTDFIATPLVVTHFNTDGACEVTLCVRASNDTDNVADRGAYTAQQTITATWGSDN
jgi:hypothetical protein